MKPELWKAIPSQPELLASSRGRIQVIPYEGEMPHGGKRPYGGIPTFGQWTGKRFVYCRRGHKTLKVARLVCEAFYGQAPTGTPNCLHKDEDARNNRPSNLKWGTQKENLNAPGFLEYCRGRTGGNNPFIKGRRVE